MSKIKFCALGGLGENGKNLYTIEVDNKIFILDAGIKYPSVDLFGIDRVIPDMKYLEDNKEKVQGIFLSHGHAEHIEAVPELLKKMNISVYGTRFTMELLEEEIVNAGLNVKNFKLYKINPFKDMKFGNIKVSFFNTTHSIPESVGITIHTADGLIVYAPDYTFNQNFGKKYKTSFDKLAKYKQEKVLCFLGESLGAEELGDDSKNYKLQAKLNRIFARTNKRIIITTFSTDLIQLQQVIETAKEFNKKIAIIGRKTQRVVDKALSLDYLDIPKGMLQNLKFINTKNDNDLEDLVVIVAGDRHEPYYMLNRMNKKIDKLIHLKETDTVVTMTLPVSGTEKMASKTIDSLYKNDIKVETIKKDLIPNFHASKEDIKLMINLLRPTYIIPVSGEYRHQYAMKSVTKEMNYADSNVPILDNGEVATFDDGILSTNITKVQCGDLLKDGSLIGDINNVVLRDRELLSKDGVFLAVCNISVAKREIINSPEIVSRGFAYMKDNKELTDKAVALFEKVTKKHLVLPKVDLNEMRNEIRDQIGKFLFKETKRRPIVIPLLVDVR